MSPRPLAPTSRPSLRLARAAMREHRLAWVGGMDEVGRGALAGPVTVGVVVVDPATRSAPPGLDDSKRLTPLQRERLVPRLQRWAPAWAVGHADNDEIDAWGILLALRVAGLRALASLPVPPERLLLDGTYDWLHRPQPTDVQGDLLDGLDEPSDGVDAGPRRIRAPHVPEVPWELSGLAAPAGPPVDLMPKADRRCAAVAAASVLAKVTRDRLMSELGDRDPRWGWQHNKGYSAPEHLAALRLHGPCGHHRRSWNLRVLAEGARPGAPGPRTPDGLAPAVRD
ncbi:ribonuclease HII [Aquipuribacter sp. SD81]|uniref:ribonuclease HII n=1 Tax=Aquipuribacter sp. SD81 TaxID=3127703 RepID=UPI0030164416